MKLIRLIVIISLLSGLDNIGLKAQEYVSEPTKNLIIGGVALHPSQTSGYIMVGRVKKIGGYLKLKSNLNFDKEFETQGNSANKVYFTDKVSKGRYSGTGGLLFYIPKSSILYVGLGYGTRWINWQTLDGCSYRVNDFTHHGLETEAGFLIKLKKVVLNCGVSSIPFEYMETNLGIGYIF